jgi:ATP-dependent Clp protease ATP-binding subunit ClpA
VDGVVSGALRGKRRVELNISAMVAGAEHRGECGEPVRKILEETSEPRGETIPFIEGIHTTVGAGLGGGEGEIGAGLLPDKATDQTGQAAAPVTLSATARPVEVPERKTTLRRTGRAPDCAAPCKNLEKAADLGKEIAAKETGPLERRSPPPSPASR